MTVKSQMDVFSEELSKGPYFVGRRRWTEGEARGFKTRQAQRICKDRGKGSLHQGRG